MAETWRIETHDTVHAVEVVRRGACWAVASDGDHAVLHSTPRIAAQAWAFRNSVMGMVLAPGEPTRAEAVAAVAAERDALLAVCERFSGDDGVVINGYEDDSGCGGCGANANHSDADPANHAPDCVRIAARVLVAKIRAGGV